MIAFTVRTAEATEAAIIASLAHEIWNEYYPPIIGQDQVDYMLGHMYSLNAIVSDIESGISYLLLYADKVPGGFCAVEVSSGKAFLHKLYVGSDLRGTGAAVDLLHAAEKAAGHSAQITLQVNRKNVRAINFYFRNGFTIKEVFDKPIGNGFVMEDFLMIKQLKKD